MERSRAASCMHAYLDPRGGRCESLFTVSYTISTYVPACLPGCPPSGGGTDPVVWSGRAHRKRGLHQWSGLPEPARARTHMRTERKREGIAELQQAQAEENILFPSSCLAVAEAAAAATVQLCETSPTCQDLSLARCAVAETNAPRETV
jgi:hypothetical protein